MDRSGASKAISTSTRRSANNHGPLGSSATSEMRLLKRKRASEWTRPFSVDDEPRHLGARWHCLAQVNGEGTRRDVWHRGLNEHPGPVLLQRGQDKARCSERAPGLGHRRLPGPDGEHPTPGEAGRTGGLEGNPARRVLGQHADRVGEVGPPVHGWPVEAAPQNTDAGSLRYAPYAGAIADPALAVHADPAIRGAILAAQASHPDAAVASTVAAHAGAEAAAATVHAGAIARAALA